MDGLAFHVCGETCDQVTKSVAALKLHKNLNRGYGYNNVRAFEKKSSANSNASFTTVPMMV